MKLSRSLMIHSPGFDIQSLVDSHDQPFVVIDSDYRIVAINEAYERAFGTDKEAAIGQHCYRVSHKNDAPCHESGEDCPHLNLFELGKRDSCEHTHYDINNQICKVRVTAYPLRGVDGDLYMGELVQELGSPESREQNAKRMVGATMPFVACLEQLRMTALVHAPVLLQGETGTGKELAANYIHTHSPRADKPFLTVDCTVLTEPLFEAEVFGYARGAFTGSVGEHIGLFEQANGGTLFLDEVGELPLSQQAKLLRALETGQYRRVGGRRYRKSDVRIVCATNRHLWESVTAGQFREDLYYRIACLAVRLPPLRERLDDIKLLAPALLSPICRASAWKLSLTDGAIERLKQYNYPGNIRELRNILYIAATQSGNGEISATLIDDVLQQLSRNGTQPVESAGVAAPSPQKARTQSETSRKSPVSAATLQDVEAHHIADLLARFQNNRRKVAEYLHISERTLYRKLKRYQLNHH
jgi:transcriptional regulator with PAS, ATPase and Fis domain